MRSERLRDRVSSVISDTMMVRDGDKQRMQCKIDKQQGGYKIIHAPVYDSLCVMSIFVSVLRVPDDALQPDVEQ